jgi:Tfp pilus assembly protein PilX
MPNLIHKNEKGAVLPIGLMFLAIISIIGTTAVIITTTDLKIGTNYKHSELLML